MILLIVTIIQRTGRDRIEEVDILQEPYTIIKLTKGFPWNPHYWGIHCRNVSSEELEQRWRDAVHSQRHQQIGRRGVE